MCHGKEGREGGVAISMTVGGRGGEGGLHVPRVVDDGEILVGVVELLVAVRVHNHAQPCTKKHHQQQQQQRRRQDVDKTHKAAVN